MDKRGLISHQNFATARLLSSPTPLGFVLAFALTVVWTAALHVAPAQAINLNPISAVKGAKEVAVEDRGGDDIATDLKIKASVV